MRILQFRSLCDTGGVSTVMHLLGNQLTLRGIECEYWFCRPSNRLPEFMASGRATLGPLSKLAPRLERGDFDVVHLAASDEFAPLVARMAGRARVVVTAHGALAEGWNRQTCFAYTAVSAGLAEVNRPYTDLEIEVVRNAIDVGHYSAPDALDGGAPIVAFVGRTTHDIKDFPRFTRIAAHLVQDGARVWIADPHGASWQKFANADVTEVPVERWGPVPHAEIRDFYKSVAASGGVVLMTSQSEGFGNVAPEAAACGARVAAPDVMGLREAIVDTVTGRLFDATASDLAVADMLRQYLRAPHDMQAVSQAARDAFSPAILTDKYEHIYRRDRQALQTRPVPPRKFAKSEVLHEHLMAQRVLRAHAALTAAHDFASEGYADLAIGALRYGFRIAPREYATRNGLKNLFRTMRGLAGRSAIRRLARRADKL